MSIFGLDLDTTQEHELSFDPGKGTPDAVKWTLGTLDSRVMGRIRDESTTLNINRGEEIMLTTVNMNEMNFRTCMFGIKGWRNFTDRKGAPIAYATVTISLGGVPYTIVDPTVLKRVPAEALQEMGEIIRNGNKLDEVAAGNSAT